EDGMPPPIPESVTKEPPPVKGSQLFERDDFGEVLEPFQYHSSPAAVAIPSSSSSARKGRQLDTSDFAPLPNPDVALVLTRKHVTLASVLIVLGLGLAFAVGLWVGLSLH